MLLICFLCAAFIPLVTPASHKFSNLHELEFIKDSGWYYQGDYHSSLLEPEHLTLKSPEAAAAAARHHNKFKSLAFDCKPTGSSKDCNGHGRCTGEACLCDKDTTKGQWAGDKCETCEKGWAGPTCTQECAGGSCNICNGHGQCDQKDGRCKCNDQADGHWDGNDCNECKPYYWSLKCDKACPGFTGDASTARTTVCSGRGACSAGTLGSGLCLCNPGYGSDSGCANCDSSHYGEGCKQLCSGYVPTLNAPCSGHGVCSNGTTGNGRCTCDFGYAGEICNKQCPGSDKFKLCGGHGICSEGILGDGKCTCNVSYAPDDCTSCVYGKTGLFCLLDCPAITVGETKLPCSGHGKCTYSGNTPLCVCNDGYSGSDCSTSCPGNPPCSGHGTCVVDSQAATCECFFNQSKGFFTGATCDTCGSGWSGQNCDRQCPKSGDLVCSNRGTCVNGTCFCQSSDAFPTVCGTACEKTQKAQCDANLCPQPFQYGINCQDFCPGRISVGNTYVACNGNGFCSDSKIGTGLCTCDPAKGFTGKDCKTACPVGTVSGQKLVCSGTTRGRCSFEESFGVTTAFCICEKGYAGPACETPCPFNLGDYCAGHGTCNYGAKGDGKCTCSKGWTGDACDILCLCDSTNGICKPGCKPDAQMQCGDCLCSSPQFVAKCDTCADKFFGDSCDQKCLNGTTKYKECMCNTYFSGPACDIACPKTADGICSGHGTCDWGNKKLGNCICTKPYYGPFCNVSCEVDLKCKEKQKKVMVQCGETTGDCECINDQINGHWAGELCDVCLEGYYGEKCLEQCGCSNRGSCNKQTGLCKCYSDDDKGHFAGSSCAECAEGFIGAQCKQRNVRITRLHRQMGSATDEGIKLTCSNPQALLVDHEYKRMYTGGCPLFVFNIDLSLGSKPSIDKIASSFEPKNIYGCGQNTGEVAGVWLHGTHVLVLIQPNKACGSTGESPRIFVLPRNPSQQPSPFDAQESQQVTITLPSPPGDEDGLKWDVNDVITNAIATTIPNPEVQYGSARYVIYMALYNSKFNSTKIAIVSVQEFVAELKTIRLKSMTVTSMALSTTADKLVIGGRTYYPNQWQILMTKSLSLGSGEVFSDADLISLKDVTPCFHEECEKDCATCNVCTPDELMFNGDVLWVAMSTTLKGIYFGHVPLPQMTEYQKGASVYVRPKGTTQCVQKNIISIGAQFTNVFDTKYDFGASESLTHRQVQSALPVWVQAADEKDLPVATSVALDSYAQVAYLSINRTAPKPGGVQLPGIVMKFIVEPKVITDGSVEELSIYGSRELTTAAVGANKIPEVFTATFCDENARVMYAITASTYVVRVVNFLLYEAYTNGLTPSLADSKGSTKITVKGRGFRNITGFHALYCRFGTNQTITKQVGVYRPTYIDANTVICVAPQMNADSGGGSSSGTCEGQLLEISFFNGLFPTENNNVLKRVLTPRLDSKVTPDTGSIRGDLIRPIVVRGSGFVTSEYLTCRYFSCRDPETRIPQAKCTDTSLVITHTQDSTVKGGTVQVGNVLASYGKVKFISPSEVWCYQAPSPDATKPSFQPSFIDISIDGQVFTGATVPYKIVGDAKAITTPYSMTIKANVTTSFSLEVLIVDSEWQAIMTLDTDNRTIQFNVTIRNCPPYVNVSTREIQAETCTMKVVPFTLDAVGGRVVFANIPLHSPKSGTYDILLKEMKYGWYNSTKLIIVEGDPVAIKIDDPTKKILVKKDMDLEEIRIFLVDNVGNEVKNVPSSLVFHVRKYVSYYDKIMDKDTKSNVGNILRVLPREDMKGFEGARSEGSSKIRFGNIRLQAIHGHMTILEFYASGSNLTEVNSSVIETYPCPAQQFKVYLTTDCATCPNKARCTGDGNIETEPGYWRASTLSLVVYPCDNPQVCLSSNFSAADKDGRVCSPGYKGPLCSVCDYNQSGSPKYGRVAGKSQCGECAAHTTNLLLIAVVLFFGLIVLAQWTMMTLRKNETTDLSVVIRMFVSHLQVTGKLNEFKVPWGDMIKQVFVVQSSGSDVQFGNLAALDCILRYYGGNHYQIFLANMSLPLVSFLMGVIVFTVFRLRKLKPEMTKELKQQLDQLLSENVSTEIQNATREFLTGYPFMHVMVTTLCVNIFVMYQTLITQSAIMLRCRKFSMGFDSYQNMSLSSSTGLALNEAERQFLEVDMSIECGTAENRNWQLMAVLFAIGYGFGIPLLLCLGMIYLRKTVGTVQANFMLNFMIGGFRAECWYWQAVIMVRKMAMVLIIVFIEHDRLQSYCAMWAMSICLVLQLWFSPYEKEEHNFVETTSLAVLTVTINLALLYFTDQAQPNQPMYYVLTIILALITIGATVIFFYYMWKPFKETVEKELIAMDEKLYKNSPHLRRQPGQPITWADIKTFIQHKLKGDGEEDDKSSVAGTNVEMEEVKDEDTRSVRSGTTIPTKKSQIPSQLSGNDMLYEPPKHEEIANFDEMSYDPVPPPNRGGKGPANTLQRKGVPASFLLGSTAAGVDNVMPSFMESQGTDDVDETDL